MNPSTFSENSACLMGARIAIAPMMQYTDRHFRYLIRLMNPHVWLYTEMVTVDAIIHGKQPQHCLDYDPIERPIALQLGGSDPSKLAYCTALAVEDYRYTAVNLNVGCPSQRVSDGAFGAQLMKKPEQVARCIRAMRAAAPGTPITVKTRIGVDDFDQAHHLDALVSLVADAGCTTLIIHARKAWLKGLSPRENRNLPPLCYERVYRLKETFPHLSIWINGGIKNDAHIAEHLKRVDGVMIGRQAWKDPYWFARMHNNPISREAVVLKYRQYMSEQSAQGHSQQRLVKPLMGLYTGVRGARAWRQSLCD